MSSTKTTDKSVWHICDDCLTPMEKELGEIVRKWRTLAKDGGTPYPGMIEWLYKKHDVEFVVTWLKLCVSVDFADDFERTLFDPLKKLQSLHAKVLQFDRSLYFTGQTIKEFLDKRYELHRKRGHSREDISDKELEYVENADSEIEHLFLYAIRYLQQVAAVLRAKLRGKGIKITDIPKDEWSFPAKLLEWRKRFGNVSDRALREWRQKHGFRMKRAATSGYWIVHEDEPKYKEWKTRDRNRTSLND